MTPIGVECRFIDSGRVQVQRIRLGESWLSVGQGRQWVDEAGRHVLIMLPDQQVRELLLRAQTLDWVLLPSPNAPRQMAV